MMFRWNQHIYNANSRPEGKRSHFWAAIRKYGKDAFSHEILEVCGTLEEANLAEAKWIDHFDSRNPEKGFNLMKGGEHIPHPKKNPWDDPGFREKVTISNQRAYSDPIIRDKAISAMKKSFARPESKEKRSKSSSLMWGSNEYRAKNNGLWKDPDFRSRCQFGLVHGASLNKRKTHCRNGHEYTEENTYISPSGSRICKICSRKRGRENMRAVREREKRIQISLNS